MAVLIGSYSLSIILVSALILALTYITYKMLGNYVSMYIAMKPIPEMGTTFPIIGNALQLKTQSREFFDQIVALSNKFYTLPMYKIWLGTVPFVILYHPNTVESILNNSIHMDKSHAYTFLHPWLGTGLLTSTGTKWRQRRKMLTPTFHFSILTDFLEVMNEQAEILVEKLQEKAGKGKFDCFAHVTLCALDIICETAMGKKIYAQSNSESEYVKCVYKMSDIVSRRQRAPWFWPDFLYYSIGDGKEHDKMLKILHSFTCKVIRYRGENISNTKSNGEADGKKRRAFLDMLLKTVDEEGNSMSQQDIQEEVDTFMFEGHDTTAAAMNWALHLAGSHPEVQRRVHQELDQVFGTSERPINMEDLKKLKYLDCVIKEALRLYPSVPFFARTICRDTTIKGYTIPKGSNIIVFLYVLHRDPRCFPEPEEFRPERFLPENSAGRPTYAYIPFSAGPRNCIGQRFAMVEEKVVLASILRNFTVEACQEREDLMPVGELILRPEKGIWIKLEKRAPRASAK
ncbi:cytochrome P450 4V2-like [Eucyclogobius newberryi]|uniref:cytochrome P450 4V2-like n=1 Tax=Eucyclogobius newberryi TaxID=166745 RepID=UPI003B5A0C32